jgi:crotonobetainyl-CoA:carnitine CoA-transferase CaiB-like acyl-CoA transferase
VGALDGIRVLEIGLLVQGPQAAAMLADLGADVVKVELPGFGEQARWIIVDEGDPRSAYFLALNRDKRSVALDVRTEGGREAFLRLAASADVVISNFKPGTMEAWGLGYEDLSAVNPRIVYGAGSLHGSLGPEADREGADIAGQAAGGLIATTGADGGEVTPVGATIADHIASQHLAVGVLAALLWRERTGQGQKVEVSLIGGQIYAQAAEYTHYFLTGSVPGRANRGHPLIHAAYGIFRTADGWIALVGVPLPAREAFYRAIDREDLYTDARFQAILYTGDTKRQLFEELETTFHGRTTHEWCEILKGAGIRFAPVRTYADVATDPQVWANGYLFTADHPTFGPLTMVGSPLQMSETPPAPGVVAPELGQHTEEVLLEAGLTWDDIAELHARGAFG